MKRRFTAAKVAAMAALAPTVVALAATGSGTDAIGSKGQDSRPSIDEALGAIRTPDQKAAIDTFLASSRTAGVIVDETGLPDRIYGAPMGGGASSEASADAAVASMHAMLGTVDGEVVRREVIEMMHYADGTPKFHLHRFVQMRDGVEVYSSRVGVLVRNEPGYPVSLVTSDAKPIGDFRPDQGLLANEVPVDAAAAIESQDDIEAGIVTRYSNVKGVIFAGHESRGEAPVNAVYFEAEAGDVTDPTSYSKIKYIVEAATGAILHEESMVHQVEVTGEVKGNATIGVGGMQCDPEDLVGLPYARVDIDGAPFFADSMGRINADVDAIGSISVNSQIRGQYFEVNNEQGANSNINTTVAPGSPFEVIHNEANASDERRAEVNTYLESNVIRDEVLRLVPNYPVIGTQTGFDINVNINDNCNAFYNGSSINFFTSGGGCGNTAFASVIYHEYGHHLVATGGSGQGAYGEGMSDTVSALLLDDPRLGLGFFTNCSSPLRNADNNCQYQTSGCSSCGSAIHSCGQLISGAVWDTREALGLKMGDPVGLDYTLQLALNSIILHTGSSIDPTITVDFLTLDDDDANIGNGTPNYQEINGAFSIHNMAGPELDSVAFQFAEGLPSSISPNGDTVLRFNVDPVTDSAVPGTIALRILSPDTTVMALPTGNPNEYQATFPASDCGTTVAFWVQAQTTLNGLATFPADAPFETLETVSAEAVEVAFADDFETPQGWTVENFGGLSDGAWQRGIPAGGGDRGDPPADADGSSRAYVTDNADGNSDVDGGGTRLVSPIMDASAEGNVISYYRWYSNTFGAAPNADVFEVEISDDGGATWTNLETVGPGGPEVDGNWFYKQFNLADIAGFELNDQFRIRFTASDLGEGSVVEAGVDGVELLSIDCTPSSIPGDANGDGLVNFDDLLSVLANWGPCAGCGADFDGNGQVDFDDLLSLLALL